MGDGNQDVVERAVVEKTASKGIERRDFLKGATVGVVGMGALPTLFGCSNGREKAVADDSSTDAMAGAHLSELTGWTSTPDKIAALGGSTMPLAELNKRRREYLDAQSDYTCADGTVIPAVFVRVRALVHTYGMGCGSTPADNSFEGIMGKFSEEDAQAFIDMPMGEKFTAIDLYEKTGRPLQECVEVCERIAEAGYLCRFTNNNGVTYHQVPFFQGVLEYHLSDYLADPNYNIGLSGSDSNDDTLSTGTPTFYVIPCDKSVVADGIVPPFDDVESLFKGKGTIAIAPCFCRLQALAMGGVEDCPTLEDFATGEFEDYFSPLHDLRVETCLMMGDEAEFWIHKGYARKITEEEALAFMQRSRDDGFILESCFSKDSGTICSCHSKCCGVIRLWQALGSPAEIGAAKPFDRISNFTLEVDLASCLKCGKCADRCPVSAISMSKEMGAPVVNEMCFKCGQCAYVCPQKIRKLVMRPEEEILELPRDFLDDANMKAGYRFEHGLIL